MPSWHQPWSPTGDTHRRPAGNAAVTTWAGAERCTRLRGLAETACQQGHNLLYLLRQDPEAPAPAPAVRQSGQVT